jgi:uncharacterized protein YcbK (DUF882 family)
MRRPALLLALLLVPVAAHARSQDAHGGGHGKGKRARSYPPLEMHQFSTGESFVLAPDKKGNLPTKRLRGLRHFLRCHHTGREHRMDPRLARFVYDTARHFGVDEVTVVAGYRAPRIAREKGNPRSHHKEGRACDFRFDGVDNVKLEEYLRHHYHGVGVGLYPNSGFVHLDVGRKKNAFWIDCSGPGERARYSDDPERALRQGCPPPPPPVEEQTPGDADDPGIAQMQSRAAR